MTELAQRFGARVAELVLSETQERCGDPCMTWETRKRAAIAQIAGGGRASKIIALSDKLSNMRAIRRDFERDGERTFARFHQNDKRRHAWYYRSFAALLKDELEQIDHAVDDEQVARDDGEILEHTVSFGYLSGNYLGIFGEEEGRFGEKGRWPLQSYDFSADCGLWRTA